MGPDPWVGRELDGWVLTERLATGPFSTLYLAATARDAEQRVVKIAIRPPGPPAPLATEALIWGTGRLDDADPEPEAVLREQFAHLRSVQDPAVITVEHLDETTAHAYYRMPYVTGSTLRDAMRAGPIPVGTMLGVLDALARLEAQTAFLPHGDLKPENILLGPQGPILIDPGYSGPLPTAFGIEHCYVLTLAYYPELHPDDLVAAGIVLCELVTGRHPRYSPSGSDPARPGERLAERIRGHQRVGDHHADWLLAVQPPHVADPRISPAFSEVLLQALRLQVLPSGAIEAGEGFGSFAELAGALRAVVAAEQIVHFPPWSVTAHATTSPTTPGG